ncbi:uncharacterized protein LOC129761723 [Toxorhynchites rutilus septentrionalis]|uniref:uncharacterized protein LOC129761723 n=1 Tax=Toxorhynchites rutilus septentrionalis TaxID=329112 RepID=UPI00247B001A|nr:uncharacterized protein LOC129761723 [Toxorhynchites rutilus septentrionalis]
MKLTDNIIILGDFNLPGIAWSKGTQADLFPDLSRSTISVTATKLLDEYSTAGLCQINDISNDNNRFLDLCFVSNELLSKIIVARAPAALVKTCRHHPPLLVSFIKSNTTNFTNTAESFYYSYQYADFTSMNHFLNALNWDELLIQQDVDATAANLSYVLLYAIDQFVPKKRKKVPVHPPWSNSSLRRLKTIKKAVLRRFSRYRNDLWKSRCVTASKNYRILNKRLFGEHQSRVQRKLKLNPKCFWKHINLQRNESGLPSVMTYEQEEASTIPSISDLFRRQFSRVFVDNSISDILIQRAVENTPVLPEIGPHPIIDAMTVLNVCSKLKASSNCGPDGIPSIILKRCSASLSLPLSTLFNNSIQSGIFPKAWKQSFVFPVYKKGCKRNVKNYRGIACLCAMSKLFEAILLDFMHHACKNYIAEEQHGFVPKRSTSTNLLLYTSFISKTLESRSQVDAIYTDFSAAFDKINHQITIAKLHRIGFNGPLLHWLESYLTGRTMSVKIGDFISSPFDVTSGVPQGSHLGPLIFVLYLNDVNSVLKCMKLSYADDFKLFVRVNNRDDATFLQRQLEIFASWSEANCMSLNSSKCSVISFSRKHTTIQYDYELFGSILNRVTCIKDLGIILNSKITFSEHIAYAVSKASKALGFIFRTTKHFTDIQCLKVLYCSLVRSILEYASVVWAPYYHNNIQRVESVQRKFVRYALRRLHWNDPQNLPRYEDRCKLLGLDQLCVRRNTARVVFVYDLIQANIDCSGLLSCINFNVRRRNLSNHEFLRLPTARTNYSHHEPVASMARTFNRHFENIDFHISRNRIKNRLRQAQTLLG